MQRRRRTRRKEFNAPEPWPGLLQQRERKSYPPTGWSQSEMKTSLVSVNSSTPFFFGFVHVVGLLLSVVKSFFRSSQKWRAVQNAVWVQSRFNFRENREHVVT
jgi:hypothetical protein